MNRRQMIVLSIIFAVCVLIEIFVCNANSLHSRFNTSGGYANREHTRLNSWR